MDLPALFGLGVACDPAELNRLLSLPRRVAATPQEVAAMSAFFRRPGYTCELRPKQAEALRELHCWRGLFAPMRVGAGKTIPTLLAPTMLDAKRPVLIVPASLRDKTRRDFAAYYAEGWRVTLPRIVSYEELGRPDRAGLLDELKPDLVILDEAHKTRNRDAACTRRIGRAIAAFGPVVVALSGTLITDSLLDYWHLLRWTLGDRAPVPRTRADAEHWAQALDREVALLQRLQLGDLAQIPGGFHAWLLDSAGVVPTPGSDCDARIVIQRWRPELPAILRSAIEYVETQKARPDAEPLDEWELPNCLARLALGHYTIWDPMPPAWWLAPRRGWRIYSRAVLDEHVEGLDSEGQLVAALDHGRLPHELAPEDGRSLLTGWRGVRDRFRPNPVPVWIDDTPIRQALEHAGPRGCLLWTRFKAVGERLAQYGVPYYGEGANPEAARGETIAIGFSHREGKNLQHHYARSLVLTPTPNDEICEQLIGRTHRYPQSAPEVLVELLSSIDYHEDAISRARASATIVSKNNGWDQKLVAAEWR